MNESQQYIEILNKEYIDKHLREQERDELIQENNVETRDIKGYHGREILELLQNADDAYQKSIEEGNQRGCELEVMIQFKNNVLTVSNTGTYFDNDGIKAIVQGNNSPKTGTYIGNKGTGFRSVLNWADKIRIYSGQFNIEFSRDIAEKKFNEIKSEPQIQKQLKTKNNLYIPILAIPQNIDSKAISDRTTIEITVKPEKLNDGFGVLEQIKNIDLRVLLFLPNISKIMIETDDEKIRYEKVIDCDNKVALKKIIDGNIQIEESFNLYKKVINKKFTEDNDLKDIQLAIAVPDDYDKFQSSHLYTFFPLMETKSPFNCVMHATYVLGDHRDTITSCEINKTIIKHQLQFLKEVAIKFADKRYGNLSLKLLTPIGFEKFTSYNGWTFVSAFSKFKLEEHFFELLIDANILQTVNNSYISIKDFPKRINGEVPSVFKGEHFNNVLQSISEDLIHTGAEKLINKVADTVNVSLEYDEYALLKIVNDLTLNWTKIEQVEVFSWWNDNYSHTLPNLLKTTNGKWLDFEDDCYFLVGDINKKIPSWVKVPSLAAEYQELLFTNASQKSTVYDIRKNDTETHISRLISQNKIYPLIKFAYRDKNNIITTVNGSVDKTYNKAVDFIKWLWSNYKTEVTNWTPPKGTDVSPIRYNFPSSTERSVHNAEQLYFGLDYGYELSSKLFDSSNGKFPAAETFAININEHNEFVDFIKKFGVKVYPKIEKQEVKPKPPYDEFYKHEILKSGEGGRSNSIHIQYKLPFIKDIENILYKLSTNEVLLWILKDESLRALLGAPSYFDHAEISFKGLRQTQSHNYRGEIKNYLLFIFNNTKWVEVAGKKYAPIEILNGVTYRTNPKFSEILPVISIEFIESIAKKLKIDYDKVLGIFKMFDFCDKVTDLPSNDFYDLLLKLPTYEFQQSVELSKAIYRIIEHTSFIKKFDESRNKTKFFDEGRLLVKLQGELTYYPAKESYLPSAKIILKHSLPIIEKGQRTNNSNFSKTFGCQEYDNEYSIKKESISLSKSNQAFQDYFKEFSKFARAYGNTNNTLEMNAGRLTIKLVNKISIIENGEVTEVQDNYILLRDTLTSWYITVLSNEFDINLLSEQIENIYSNIANTPGFDAGKIGELFRTKNKFDREFLIKKEFGSLGVIDDNLYNNQVKNNFIGTVQKIDSIFDFLNSDINFDDFFHVDNSKAIIATLKKLNVDVNAFRDAGFVYAIDLIPYYKKQCFEYLRKELKNYKDVNYALALKDKELQKYFLDKVAKFEDYNISTYENSIYFNVEDKVHNNFGKWKNLELVDADKTYEENYYALNPDDSFAELISNDSRVKTIIYFGIKSDFEQWRVKQVENLEKERSSESNDIYKDFKNIVPDEKTIEFHKAEERSNTRLRQNQGTFTQVAEQKRNKAKKILGNKGELLVYNKLCKDFGKENVFPKSEAFVEMGIIRAGLATSGSYDLSYIDAKDKEFFVEVKTSGDGKSFIITLGELEFAKENPERFKLYLVSKIDSSTPIVNILENKFWNNKKFRMKEIIEKIEVTF